MGSVALFLIACSSWLLIPHFAAAAPRPPIRAVNLGGWLVTKGWIMPGLFNGIRNNDTMDGTQLQFMSGTQSRYLVADQGGGATILADRTNASSWETFRLWRINETTFNFRVNGGQFWGVNSSGALVATATTPGPSETFQIVRRNSSFPTRVRIRAPNGLFLQVTGTVRANKVKNMTSITADRGEFTDWSNNDPSVFVASNVGNLYGEYQICNGYGKANATQNHRNTFITEKDFDFTASSGLNAVRIPVGWLIASDPNPPPPFVGGSLQFLDNAFSWAQLSSSSSPANFTGAVLDVHYYNLFDIKFDTLTVQQNIDFVRNNRSADLKAITNQNGRPLTFVGEWAGAWAVQGANATDYKRFARIQQDVYGNATFGWAYWTLQNVNAVWNMTYMIQNGIITLKS
ncbi:hypothetical protein HU200_021771 [Digitaria exilis]|uniref:DUF7910 domain-containing protein n=1 Tax=Digitaria exilis TaxID=1010633 RepID=A0A835KCW4_9POAL|nr:hypothetical protein HU200_021771 [Digitaria exilis]